MQVMRQRGGMDKVNIFGKKIFQMLLLFSSLFLYCFITFFYFYFWCTPRPLELDPPMFLNKMLKNRGKYFCIAMKLCIAKKNVFLMAHHCYIATLPKVSTRLEHFHLIISLFNLHFTLYIYSFLLLSELGLHFISFIHRFLNFYILYEGYPCVCACVCV